METKQQRRNRHITQAHWTDSTQSNGNGSNNLREAQLILNSLLTQAEIAELNRQLVEAGTIKEQRKVLEAWYDMMEQRESKPATIFEMVEAAIKNTDGRWPKTIYEGNGVKVYISSFNQELTLVAQVRNDRTTRAAVKCGQLHYIDGWMFTLKQAQYQNWVSKVKGLLK